MEISGKLEERVRSFIMQCSLSDLTEIGAFCFGLHDSDVLALRREVEDVELAKYEKAFEKWNEHDGTD